MYKSDSQENTSTNINQYSKLKKMKFLCSSDPPQRDCCGSPSGNFIYNSELQRCYFVSDPLPRQTKSYEGAKAECAKMGADLLSINSLAEHDFIRPHLVNSYGMKLQ